MIAALLIVASGAVAAGLSGKAPWRSVSLLFAPQAVPVEHATTSAKPQLGRGAVPVAPPAATPVADVAGLDAALVVAEAMPAAAAPAAAHAHEASRRTGAASRTALKVSASALGGADTPKAKDAAPEPAASAAGSLQRGPDAAAEPVRREALGDADPHRRHAGHLALHFS